MIDGGNKPGSRESAQLCPAPINVLNRVVHIIKSSFNLSGMVEYKIYHQREGLERLCHIRGICRLEGRLDGFGSVHLPLVSAPASTSTPAVSVSKGRKCIKSPLIFVESLRGKRYRLGLH